MNPFRYYKKMYFRSQPYPIHLGAVEITLQNVKKTALIQAATRKDLIKGCYA